MLSICIPVFNYDISPLVECLNQQAAKEGIAYEILIADDASTMDMTEVYHSISKHHEVIVILSETNLGRAAIRNLLASKAKYPFLLFLDSDTMPVDDTFISKYINAASQAKVVCGGISYRPQKPEKSKLLRWKFGHKREHIPASLRAHNPYNSFMTGNFLCQKSIFNFVQFDESLKKYGHEDTLFGFALASNAIEILHTDNPVYHEGIEDNTIFLNKTEESIKNLLLISLQHNQNKEFYKNVKLLNLFHSIKKHHLHRLVKILSYPLIPLFKHLLRHNLIGLRGYSFLKLLFICRLY